MKNHGFVDGNKRIAAACFHLIIICFSAVRWNALCNHPLV
ncbi:Fic family protein [Algoriphagus sp. Y33]|nr:Fic family protein [Algoriphagus sp. Y33]